MTYLISTTLDSRTCSYNFNAVGDAHNLSLSAADFNRRHNYFVSCTARHASLKFAPNALHSANSTLYRVDCSVSTTTCHVVYVTSIQ